MTQFFMLGSCFSLVSYQSSSTTKSALIFLVYVF